MSNYDYIGAMGDSDWLLPCNQLDNLTLYDCKHCPYYGQCERGAHIISSLQLNDIEALPLELQHRILAGQLSGREVSDSDGFDEIDKIDGIDDNFDDIEEYKGGLLLDWLKD